MSEYTIEGDESMRWDVIADDSPVEAAPQSADKDDTVACDGCRGDGIYYGRGAVVNGKFEGFTGTCYRCSGKGVQTPADVRRCQYYDNRVRRIHL